MLRRAFLHDFAEMQHRDVIRELEHDVHVVLDQQDGELADRAASGTPSSPATRRKRAPPRARRAAGSSDRWRGPERSRSGAARRARGCAPRRRGGPSSRRFPGGRGPSRARRGRTRAAATSRTWSARRPMIASSTLSRTVSFGKRLVTWNVRAMPSAVRRWLAQPVTSSPKSRTCPAVARQDAGDDVEQRRLARAVRADDRLAVAREDLQVDVLDRVQAAEALRQALQLETSALPLFTSQYLQGG